MNKIDIRSSYRYPVNRKLIRRVINKVLESYKVIESCWVEINIVGDRKMTELHKTYLNEEGTTDVLSFPLQENYLSKGRDDFAEGEMLRLGSIFVSYPQSQKQANWHHLTTDEEISQLVEHGMLHLLGIHHE